MAIYKKYPTDNDYINEEARGMCLFYKNMYLRMKRWFGFSYPFWLSDMDESHLLKNILRRFADTITQFFLVYFSFFSFYNTTIHKCMYSLMQSL